MENQLVIPTAEPFLLLSGKTGCVLVHGFTGAPKEMRQMGEALHHNGLTVLGVRLAGHATKPEDLERTRWEDWLASVEDGIHIMSNICDRIFLAGLSMGGILSLVAASRYSGLMGIIAMATPITLGDDWRLNFARPLSVLMPHVNKGKSDSRDLKTADGHVDYPAYPTHAIAELNDLIKVMQNSLKEIRIPVLLINSKTDQTVPLWHAERIEQGITSSQVERAIIEQSGHVITEDIGREKVFNAALQFIKKHGGK